MPEFTFFPDTNFHFETLRQLALAADNGADIREVLNLIPGIPCGDFEAFSRAFEGLARRVEAQAKTSDPKTRSGRVGRREHMFKAATYWRAADFYLHGNPKDPRIYEFWDRQTECFNEAVSLMDSPPTHVELPTKYGFSVPTTFYPTTKREGPAPVLIMASGYDGSKEEMLHAIGFAALERGFSVLAYDGPGQPSVRRKQGKGFIHDWEKVVTPVVDHLFEHAKELNIDTSKLVLWGQSLGGYLGLRAVAFEKRIAAYVACDGVWSLADVTTSMTQGAGGERPDISKMLKDPAAPAGLRWSMGHGLWCMFDNDETTDAEGRLRLPELMEKMKLFSIESVIDQVECPVFVGDAEEEIFFKGQPKKVADALGSKATYYLFTAESGAGAHCQAGARSILSQVTMDWIEKTVDAA